MNKRLRNRWVKALRSGKYTKNKHSLCSPDGKKHCCLGVLYEVAKGKKVPPLMRNNGVLGDDLATDIGLNVPQSELASRNDGYRSSLRALSFKQLASWIEANVPVEE
jgi:hypothetical protein